MSAPTDRLNPRERFRDRGFLTEPHADFIDAIQRSEPALFDFCDRLNETSMRVAWSLRPRKSRPQEVLSALLFVKALNSFQGSLLLLQRGMCTECEALSRTGLECAIELGAIAADSDHVNVLLKAHDQHRKVHAERMLAHSEALGPLPDQIADELRKNAALLSGSSRNLEQSARKAGLMVLYDSTYRGLSGHAAHATIGALQRLLVEEGETVNIQMGPDIAQVRRALLMAAPPLMECLLPLGKVFSREDVKTHAINFGFEFTDLAQ